jgi:hypothetical protein
MNTPVYPFFYCCILLLYSGCAKMDDYHDEPRRDFLMSHQWKITGETANGADQLHNCRKDNVLLFLSSGYIYEQTFQRCHPSEADTLRYDYLLLNNETELRISGFNGQDHHFHIVHFSDTTVRLEEQHPGSDGNHAALTLSRI